MDKSGTGVISSEELWELFSGLGRAVSKEELARIIDEAPWGMQKKRVAGVPWGWDVGPNVPKTFLIPTGLLRDYAGVYSTSAFELWLPATLPSWGPLVYRACHVLAIFPISCTAILASHQLGLPGARPTWITTASTSRTSWVWHGPTWTWHRRKGGSWGVEGVGCVGGVGGVEGVGGVGGAGWGVAARPAERSRAGYILGCGLPAEDPNKAQVNPELTP